MTRRAKESVQSFRGVTTLLLSTEVIVLQELSIFPPSTIGVASTYQALTRIFMSSNIVQGSVGFYSSCGGGLLIISK